MDGFAKTSERDYSTQQNRQSLSKISVFDQAQRAPSTEAQGKQPDHQQKQTGRSALAVGLFREMVTGPGRAHLFVIDA